MEIPNTKSAGRDPGRLGIHPVWKDTWPQPVAIVCAVLGWGLQAVSGGKTIQHNQLHRHAKEARNLRIHAN